MLKGAVTLSLGLLASSPASAQTPFWASPDPDHPLHRHRAQIEVASVHAFGLMTQMRFGAAILWPEPFAETDLTIIAGRYGDAVRLPPRWDPHAAPFEWDGDPWALNVFGHGLFGSELHLRARACRADLFGALLFTAGHSAIWEYVFEGGSVRPSGRRTARRAALCSVVRRLEARSAVASGRHRHRRSLRRARARARRALLNPW
jgi:hypothetical protein